MLDPTKPTVILFMSGLMFCVNSILHSVFKTSDMVALVSSLYFCPYTTHQHLEMIWNELLCQFVVYLKKMWPRGSGNIHGLKIWDIPKSHHTDDAGLSPVCTKIFTDYSLAKIQVKFPTNCCVARWLRCLGDVHWPQNLGPPQNPTTWTTLV